MSAKHSQPLRKQSRVKAWVTQHYDKALRVWAYMSDGVWRDTRRDWRISIIKTLNLTIRSFLDSDLQSRACALTYRTVLAIVPALALLFAICRGFGFANLLQNQLYSIVPSQHQALEMALKFVDSYLSQASEGIFVGVGILFLLWTLISLLSSVEDDFNRIWQVRAGRSMWRKVTDYLAIFLVLPVLLICSGGITIVMSTTLKKLVIFDFLGPVVNVLMDVLALVLTWLFFAGAYLLIPNAKVRFSNAFVAGALVGTSIQVIQWLFITGQMYVTKYNAIYGSFSFLPLMLIWLQLTWLATLTGALVCYASQNIGQFSFYRQVENISQEYDMRVTIAVLAVIVKRFAAGRKALTCISLAADYRLPENMVRNAVLRLNTVGLVAFEESEGDTGMHPLIPAVDISRITVADTVRRLRHCGDSNFIPGFDEHYRAVDDIANRIDNAIASGVAETRLADLDIEIHPLVESGATNDNPTKTT